jgi:hypothetical protein
MGGERFQIGLNTGTSTRIGSSDSHGPRVSEAFFI